MVNAVSQGKLPYVDSNPRFRQLAQHKAFESGVSLSRTYVALGGKPPYDYWELNGSYLIRHHVQPRRGLFDPSRSSDILVPISRLNPVRYTWFVFADGNTQSFQDSWVQRGDQWHSSHWTGMT